MKEEENAMERVAELEAENTRLRKALQKIAPSYMPFMIEAVCEADFVIE